MPIELPAKKPELSIIVPVYNEAAAIDGLFGTLLTQKGVFFELVICDGGSGDATVTRSWSLVEDAPFPVSVLHCQKGRGRQMNAGVAASCGSTILFLHADSRFTEPDALSKSIRFFEEQLEKEGNERIAGHFALKFLRRDPAPSYGYCYYESKARLSRRHCIHGDQGFLMRRSLFQEVGPFDESLPFLEDTKLAESIAGKGRWVLLPATIHTSARRFETEGLSSRQTLNAIILNFSAAGMEDLLHEIPHIYITQNCVSRLRLAPFFSAFRKKIASLPWREKRRLWRETGAYVRDNAWQLALALDIRRRFKANAPPLEHDHHPCLDFYDRHLNHLTDHALGRFAAGILVRLWFEFSCLKSFLQDLRPESARAD